jgi:methylisocitrate lyase
LAVHGVNMILYPLTATRAMNKAAEMVYQEVLDKGHQKDVVEHMQTRMELYDYLNYHEYEETLDKLFSQGKNK